MRSRRARPRSLSATTSNKTTPWLCQESIATALWLVPDPDSERAIIAVLMTAFKESVHTGERPGKVAYAS
jgi:hypothetical protein